jgi:hypothetical protein
MYCPFDASPVVGLVSPLLPLLDQVADVCVAALTEPAAGDKVVEVIAEKDAPTRSLGELFAGVNWY